MAGAKEIRNKIKSVQSTRKITKAMEMVAASKMKKAQDRMRASRPYVERALQIAMHVAKANIHTWLAWQEEPGKPIGQAITKNYLDAGAPHALKLIAWLRSLFDLGTA